MRALYWVAAVLLMTLTGCGVDWFPEFKQLPTTPNPISSQTKTDVEVSTSTAPVTVTFDPVTISGLTADSTDISVSGDASSKYAISGGTATAAAGKVKNGDTVVVSHTSSDAAGTSVTTTLTIGTAEQSTQGTFTSTTKPVGSFELTASGAPGAEVTKPTLLVAKPGSYPINVTNGSFSTEGVNGPFNTSGTIVVAGQPVTITLKNKAPEAGAAATVTTVTIGGVVSKLTTTATTP